MTNDSGSRHKRWFAEGLVIVISILLAFGIDALWAQRQLRLEEGDALAALRAEFTANLTAIERVVPSTRDTVS